MYYGPDFNISINTIENGYTVVVTCIEEFGPVEIGPRFFEDKGDLIDSLDDMMGEVAALAEEAKAQFANNVFDLNQGLAVN